MKRRISVKVKDAKGVTVEVVGHVNSNGYPLTRGEVNAIASDLASNIMLALTKLPYLSVALSDLTVER